jgi:hypothetical protein
MHGIVNSLRISEIILEILVLVAARDMNVWEDVPFVEK